mmetsp:Transcript_127909/g.409759  ORF Transcript_127909/g.409759 Transcript_127909/m.409759 type:complete len:106 (+) Transcript_127909:834-1151(+)
MRPALLATEGRSLATVSEQSAEGGVVTSYPPPALFSREPHRITCEGAAGRSLNLQGVSSGHVIYWAGIWLLVVAVLGSLLKTGGLCSEGPEAKAMRVGTPHQATF